MNKEWTFKVFVSDEGVNEVQDWIDGLPKKKRIKARSIITHLEAVKDIIHDPYFSKWLCHDYLWRVKFKFPNRELFRVFSFIGPEGNEITMLIVAQKVAGRFEPKNVVEKAEERYELIHKDRRCINDFV